MKLTKDELKKIIQEEVANMEESAHGGFRGYGGGPDDGEYKRYKDAERKEREAQADAAEFRKKDRAAQAKSRDKYLADREKARQGKVKRNQAEYDEYSEKSEKVLAAMAKALGVRNIAYLPPPGSAIAHIITADGTDGDLFPTWAKYANRVSNKDGTIAMTVPETIEMYKALERAKQFKKGRGYKGGELNKVLLKLKKAIDNRGFLKKAGSFLTGKGFNEDITKEDIQKMVQEELEAVTKGN
jgi:hypothetical protein